MKPNARTSTRSHTLAVRLKIQAASLERQKLLREFAQQQAHAEFYEANDPPVIQK